MKSLSFRLLLPALLIASLSAHAQTPSPYAGEAVYYSRLQFGGPARTQGIAGANVALGADFGNLSSNPAGLGMFRKSEFHFTPGIGLGSADASGTGAAQNQTKNSFHIASLGVVLTNRLADDDASSDWRGGSFALGISRLADYNSAFRYSGQVADNKSLFEFLRAPGGHTTINSTDYQKATANIADQFFGNTSANLSPKTYTNLDGLAYGVRLTEIVGTVHDNNLDSLYTRKRLGPITQSETVVSSGSMSQFDLGYGGSYKERLFVGGGFGIVSTNRRVVRDFSESEDDLTTKFASLTLHDEVKTIGTGVNLRLGVLYRVNDIVRLGASVQSPTFIQLTDTYSTTLTSAFSPALPIGTSGSTTGETASTAPGQYAYTIVTPFRANGGLALTLGKHGFVTGDVEYLGYQQTRLHGNPNDANGDDNSFTPENKDISDTYQNAVNVRLGAEARFGIFRLRGGYAHYGDPYSNSTVERGQEYYTGGLGFRTDGFFLDVAGVYTNYTQLYSPYTLASKQQPVINVGAKRYTTSVTAGFLF